MFGEYCNNIHKYGRGFTMGFRHDMRDKTGQQQAIVAQRDREDKLLKEQNIRRSNNQSPKSKVHGLSLFMRLGVDEKTNYNGIKTMDTYKMFVRKNDYVWFSTNSLANGMAKNKVNIIKDSIDNDEDVYIYFVVGKKGGGNNEILYFAEIVDIVTDAEGVRSPDKKLTPNEWKDCTNKIWIKVKRLRENTNLTTKDFVVISSGEILFNSIENSEYHFGYIRNMVPVTEL